MSSPNWLLLFFTFVVLFDYTSQFLVCYVKGKRLFACVLMYICSSLSTQEDTKERAFCSISYSNRFFFLACFFVSLAAHYKMKLSTYIVHK